MPPNDNAFKVMLQLQPQQFLNLLLPGAILLEVLPTELPRESLYVDALLRVQLHDKIYIVHLEVQTGPDNTMMGRILHYMGLIWTREKVPILPIILYLVPTSTPESPWQLDGPMGPINTLYFNVIKLWEQPVEEWLTGGANAALIFTPLLKGATIESMAQAAELLGTIPGAAERDNALNYLVLFAIRKFGEQMVTQYIKEHAMLDTFIIESEWYQIILDRGTREGIEKGKEQGKAQGIEQGERLMALRLARRSLESRFGSLSQEIAAALDGADEAILEEIVLNATEDLAQVRARLGI
jgi:predicted transposase YdaD